MPFKTGKFHSVSSSLNNEMKRVVSLDEVVELLDVMTLEGVLKKVRGPLGSDYSLM